MVNNADCPFALFMCLVCELYVELESRLVWRKFKPSVPQEARSVSCVYNNDAIVGATHGPPR